MISYMIQWRLPSGEIAFGPAFTDPDEADCRLGNARSFAAATFGGVVELYLCVDEF